MADIVITGGTILTMNEDREILDDGAIVVDDGMIEAIGPADEIEATYEANHRIDATDHAVIPGFIDAHNHVSDILARGGVGSDRTLYDWIFNIKFPVVGEMTPEEHAVASALWCSEAIKSGITTFVENAVGTGSGYDRDIVEAKCSVYEDAGLRSIYAQSFVDTEPDPEFQEFTEIQMAKAPEVTNIPLESNVVDTDEALTEIQELIDEFHGTADGRQSVWPGPLMPSSTSTEGLQGAYRLAEENDVMFTTHVSETEHDADEGMVTTVDYLNNIGVLGERALFGHCVHLTERDVRLLTQSDTRVAHNPLTNLALAAGFAPIPRMNNYGVTVGIGTDNTSASDTVNMLNDLRYAAMIHKANHQDPSSMTAEKALEMATIEGARAVGKEDEIGSLEDGKRADITLIGLDYDHLTPRPDVASAIVYQTLGHEIETVICDGKVILDGREVRGIANRYPNLREQAVDTSKAVLERTGVDSLLDRPWTSISDL